MQRCAAAVVALAEAGRAVRPDNQLSDLRMIFSLIRGAEVNI
jgi:hypothetical protein